MHLLRIRKGLWPENPGKMHPSMLSPSNQSVPQHRQSLRVERGWRGGAFACGTDLKEVLLKGILGIEGIMEKKRQKDLGGKQKNGHLQGGARSATSSRWQTTANAFMWPWGIWPPPPLSAQKCLLRARKAQLSLRFALGFCNKLGWISNCKLVCNRCDLWDGPGPSTVSG